MYKYWGNLESKRSGNTLVHQYTGRSDLDGYVVAFTYRLEDGKWMLDFIRLSGPSPIPSLGNASTLHDVTTVLLEALWQ